MELGLAALRGSFAALILVLSLGSAVAACSLDGVPSMSANNVLVRPMAAKPSRADLAHWAPFAVPSVFQKGRPIRFGEYVSELKRSLPPLAFAYAWRWEFGDGGTATGVSVIHAYRRSGLYRVTVWADYRTEHFWYEFDAAVIRIR